MESHEPTHDSLWGLMSLMEPDGAHEAPKGFP